MLLQWANQWRSRSNTFKDISISLTLEFIGDIQLLFRFFISSSVPEIFEKERRTLFLFRKSNLSTLFQIFLTNHWANFNKIFREDRIRQAEQKPQSCQPISSKVGKLCRFMSQKWKLLLNWANRWRSRSNTFKVIYISSTSEFIGDIKLLFPFLISWLVLELWRKEQTLPMSEFSIVLGMFFVTPAPRTCTDKCS